MLGEWLQDSAILFAVELLIVMSNSSYGRLAPVNIIKHNTNLCCGKGSQEEGRALAVCVTYVRYCIVEMPSGFASLYDCRHVLLNSLNSN